jgi:hypothetical protein
VPIVTPVGEIKKYSTDGFNAIWLNPAFDENLHELANKVLSVVKSPDKYYAMSAAAAGTFINHKKYSETLIELLNTYLGNNKSAIE